MKRLEETAGPAHPLAVFGGSMRRGDWLPWLALVCAVGISFLPALSGGFVWDDHAYLLPQAAVRELSGTSLAWMFSLDSAVAGHFHPLTWLSWAIDYALAGGFEAKTFHASNLLMHGICCVLVFELFRRLIDMRGLKLSAGWLLLVVLLYAVHPMRVESVAWITERRDVLSGIFYMATLLSYLRYRIDDSGPRWFLTTFLLFVACGLSKAWVITLPAMFWTIDFAIDPKMVQPWRWSTQLAWIRRRAPFLIAALAFAWLGVQAAQRSGAMVRWDEIPLGDRLLNAAFAWWYYPLKTLWPVDLSPYQSWSDSGAQGELRWLAPAALATLALLIAWMPRRVRHPSVAALFAYTALIFPVLGLAQSGPQIVADRYSYLAALPFHFALASGLAVVDTDNTLLRRWVVLVLGTTVVFASVAAFRLCSVWQNDFTFWSRVIEVTPGNIAARHSRAYLAFKAGDFDGAEADLLAAQQASRLGIESELALIDVYLAAGRIGPARGIAEQILADAESGPRGAVAAARVSLAEGDKPRAARELSMALAGGALDAATVFRIAEFAASADDHALRRRALDVTLRLDSSHLDALLQRASILAAEGKAGEALVDLEAALSKAPLNWGQADRVRVWVENLRRGDASR